MSSRPTPGHALAATLVLVSAWVVHGFFDALLASGVIAAASWPWYERFRSHLPRRMRVGSAAALFTFLMTVLVLGPLVVAGVALLGEARLLLHDLARADTHVPIPEWLLDLPIVGAWIGEGWRPGGLQALTQHAEPSKVLGWMQIVGLFTASRALTVAFAILLLYFFYLEGASIAHALTITLRRTIGEQAERYMEVAARAVRAAAASMLAVGLFDTVALALCYGSAGAPRAFVWSAIIGALAALPFVGYAAVAAMCTQLALRGATATALLCFVLGCSVLLVGDKVLRPMVARGGIRLPFVWVLMGCVGGFGVLGPAGLVIGPVALALAREALEQASARGTLNAPT